MSMPRRDETLASALRALTLHLTPGKHVICLCGSTRFKNTWQVANLELTLLGFTVFSVAGFGHADGITFSAEEKATLDVVHLDKIARSDAVVVLDVGGYVGESTAREILYARRDCASREVLRLSLEIPWTDADDAALGEAS